MHRFDSCERRRNWAELDLRVFAKFHGREATVAVEGCAEGEFLDRRRVSVQRFEVVFLSEVVVTNVFETQQFILKFRNTFVKYDLI